MILYRSVGMQELELIYDNGMKAFPARLPQQPIFYPVLNVEYARQIATDWNAKSGQFAGYVTQFKVEDDYISRFEEHLVGETEYQEFWIPAAEMEELNRHINGHIKAIEAYFGEGFQGFVPEKFGLQGKDAVAQFTLIANAYVYNRMDFYLEIKRNHKAVFLNFPFWQKHEFKNQGLKEKVIQAIKEAWFTSFPTIPLMNLAPADPPVEEQSTLSPLVNGAQENIAPLKKNDSTASVNSFPEESKPLEQTNSQILVNPSRGKITPFQKSGSHFLSKSPREKTLPIPQTASHFTQGVKLGLTEKYYEARDVLLQAIQADPNHVVAHTSLGVVFHRLGEDDRALACYDDALKLDVKYAEAYYFRANIHRAQEKIPKAITGYTIAIGLKPELIEAAKIPRPQDRLTDYTSYPAEMYWIARPAYRILDLTKSLETNPQQPHLLKERAAEYSRLWNYEQTIADYTSSLIIQHDDADALHLRGIAYEQIGQPRLAIEDYQQAMTVNPQISDEYINRGVSLGKLGNFRQSISNLTEGIRLAPQNPDAYFNRGTTYFQLGDFENAIVDFSNVLEITPDDEGAYYWRGVSYEGAGRNHDAIENYRHFLEISQDPFAREEVEQKLSRLAELKQTRADSRIAAPGGQQKRDRAQAGYQDRAIDLYDLVVTLGDRAIDSSWFGRNVDSSGKVEELYAYVGQNKPIAGHDFLRIASGIRQTRKGDFQAFDPGASSYWLLVHAWEGNGFYIETDDSEIKNLLKTHFQAAEEMDGAIPPYEAIFIHI